MCISSTQTRVEFGGGTEGVPQAIDDDRSLSGPHRVTARAPEVGDRVGRYVLEQRIGEGGMGVVWRAHDAEVGRRVALKFVRNHGGKVDAKQWSRLRREAQALARVRDGGVVGLYDMGHDAHGAWLALEHVHGLHLRRWLQRRPRSPAQIVDVIARAADALAAVHRAGLLHRDVKPTNLLVCEGREHGDAEALVDRVVLVDFGLALGLSESDTVHGTPSEEEITLRTRLTHSNMIVGTTSYMSPEQLLGRELDARCDIFSLCVTAYEALYARRPFAGKTPYELALTFDSGAPAAIPPRHGVGRHVERALRTGLALDPCDRFASAAELAAALRGGPRVRSFVPWLVSAAIGGL
ncbi:MAG: serine/threonine protein kinase, partial [Deltaproteobacteria bacterium]|nr:serine/threonine protein kinase [Nannocystaceae bacterium]